MNSSGNTKKSIFASCELLISRFYLYFYTLQQPTMRQTTQNAVKAMLNHKNQKISKNTRVSFEIFEWWCNSDLFLHWNRIASIVNFENWKRKIIIRDAWRETNTTKERLNWFLTMLNLPYWIVQKNRVRYLEHNWELEKRNGFKEIFY